VTNAALENLKLNADGAFVMPDGQALLNGAGQPVRLRLSRVENPHRLIAEGNGLYRINPNDAGSVTAIAADNQVQLHQGFIERSNVDAAQTMVDMNMALRAYEANQKVIQFYDKSLDKAVNEVGRV
jgi:flagellar basal-body rod protein FlgG